MGPAQVSNFIPKKWAIGPKNVPFSGPSLTKMVDFLFVGVGGKQKFLRAGGRSTFEGTREKWALLFFKARPTFEAGPRIREQSQCLKLRFFGTSRLRTNVIMPNHTIFIAWNEWDRLKHVFYPSSSVISAVPRVFGPPWPAFFRKPGPHSRLSHFPASGGPHSRVAHDSRTHDK